MAKSKDELNALKKDIEKLDKKLAELSDDEMKAVAGGAVADKENQSIWFNVIDGIPAGAKSEGIWGNAIGDDEPDDNN